METEKLDKRLTVLEHKVDSLKEFSEKRFCDLEEQFCKFNDKISGEISTLYDKVDDLEAQFYETKGSYSMMDKLFVSILSGLFTGIIVVILKVLFHV